MNELIVWLFLAQFILILGALVTFFWRLSQLNQHNKRDMDDLAEFVLSDIRRMLGDHVHSDIRLLSQRLEWMTQAHNQVTSEYQRGLESSETRWLRLMDAMDQKWVLFHQQTSASLTQLQTLLSDKLDHTLEERLGSVYQRVSTRLDDMYRGLGEMKALAQNVGDIKRVLTNVKQRGVWGEIQLSQLVAQLMSPEQYVIQARILDEGVVDLAIRLPGTGDTPLWLPIDSKLPLDPFERLQIALENGDREASLIARTALRRQVITEAKRMQAYIRPPHTTDFAILFLPIESLYIELLQNIGLMNELQSEYRVILAGPTTFSALIGSLQLGFKTLAIQQRTAEAWQMVGVLQREFGVFGDLLDKVNRKLSEAGASLDDATQKTRRIGRTLDQLSSSVDHSIVYKGDTV